MRVKVPSYRRVVTPYLTTLTGLGIPEGEAGNRAQSEPKQIGTSSANGKTARVNKS